MRATNISIDDEGFLDVEMDEANKCIQVTLARSARSSPIIIRFSVPAADRLADLVQRAVLGFYGSGIPDDDLFDLSEFNKLNNSKNGFRIEKEKKE